MNKEIWILDDDLSIVKALQAILSREGYTVEGFSKYKDLSQKLKKRIPDLLLLDVLLNNEDGLKLAKKLHDNKRYQKLPIVLVSANSISNESILESTATGFLKKPFNISDLSSVVLHSLNNY